MPNTQYLYEQIMTLTKQCEQHGTEPIKSVPSATPPPVTASDEPKGCIPISNGFLCTHGGPFLLVPPIKTEQK